jgi:poly-gamma-glutamate capsule biosynthesis protein CapA/YwtB (metallophosphatase superfamily)
VLLALVATMLGCGLVGYGFTLHLRDAQAKPSLQPSAAPIPTATAQAGPRQVTLLAAGDVIVHPPIWEQARADADGKGYNFAPMFESVTATITAADLALCHLEVPIAAAGSTPTGFPLFNAPPEVLDGLKKAGFDGCSTAGNHALDKGAEGVVRTLDAMDKAGLGHSGTARTVEEADTIKVYDVRGVKVAHLSYSYGYGVKRPSGKEWIANQIDPAVIKAAAKRAKDAKADLVVVSMHWGTEYQHEPNEDQERWAKELLATPEIDLILGHHTHSVQAMERIGDKWAVYGLGNEIARHSENYDKSREGVMARLTLVENQPGKWQVSKAEAIPTWTQLTPKVRIIELPKAAVDQALTATARKTYQTTLDRIAGYLRLRGADGAGLLVLGASPGKSPSPSSR